MCDTCKNSRVCNCDKPRRNTPEEMIEVIKAYQANKVLEARGPDAPDNYFSEVRKEFISFDFLNNVYRVKKEPRIIYTCITSDGVLYRASFNRENAANQARNHGLNVTEFVEKM